MFPIRKRIVELHLGGKVIRTTPEHPFYVEGKGWVNAADLSGAKIAGEQEVVDNLEEQPMPNFPVVGFAAGTPILTSTDSTPIEDIKPGDLIVIRPHDDQGDDEHEDHDDQQPWWELN